MRVAVSYRQSSKENYSKFCEENPDIILSYLEWCNIIYTFNYSFRDYLLETGEKVKLPWGFGEFSICKRKPLRTRKTPEGKEYISLPVDWKKTREAGKKIYHMNFHTEGYRYKWKWFISTARFKGSDLWIFKPSRVTSRLLKHYLTQDNYKLIYREWGLIK